MLRRTGADPVHSVRASETCCQMCSILGLSNRVGVDGNVHFLVNRGRLQGQRWTRGFCGLGLRVLGQETNMTLASWRYPRTSSPASQDLRRRHSESLGRGRSGSHVDSASSSASLWIEKEQPLPVGSCHPADDGGHTGEPNGTPQSAHGSGGTRPHEPGFQGCEAGAGARARSWDLHYRSPRRYRRR